MIHVAYGISDKNGTYSKFVGTSMMSMFENTKSEITVHILHDGTLSDKNIERFNLLASRYNQQVRFYYVEKICAEKHAEFKKMLPTADTSRFTIANCYTLFAMHVLSRDIEKLIYLDADTVVNLDINELWEIELGEYSLGAVEILANNHLAHIDDVLIRENIVKEENYFNAGLLYMNLEKLRDKEDLIIEGIKFKMKNPKAGFDQLIWNYGFSEQYLKLPAKFNKFVKSARILKNYDTDEKILHYVESPKGKHFGLDMDMSDSYNKKFFEYYLKSPWFDEEAIGNISPYLNKLYNERQEFMIKVTAILAGMERGFFTEFCNIEPVRKTFLLKDGEELIATDETENLEELTEKILLDGKIEGAVKKLSESMKKSSGRKVFFLLVSDNYPQLCEILESEGFTENKDFVNGQLFRSASSGEPLNVYDIIKVM